MKLYCKTQRKVRNGSTSQMIMWHYLKSKLHTQSPLYLREVALEKLTVPAAVVSRRTDVSHHHHRHHGNEMHHTHTFTSYYVTFQVESGDRMEFAVSGMEYGLLAEGDTGDLTFQGTRYLNFQRATRE